MSKIIAFLKILFLSPLVLCISQSANAAEPVDYFVVSVSGVMKYASTGQAACQFLLGNGYTQSTYGGGYCYNQNGGIISNVGVASRCSPDGSAPDISKPYAQQCSAPAPTCTAGAASSDTFATGSGPLGSASATVNANTKWPSSNGSCNVDYKTVEKCFSRPNAAGTAQDFFCTFRGAETGVSTPAGTAPSSSTVSPTSGDKPAATGPLEVAAGKSCPAGTQSLGLDSTGGMICGGSGTSPIIPPKTETKTPPVTTTNPDGSSTKVETTTRTNTDGSVSTTTKTTVTGTDGGTSVIESTATGQKPGSSGGGAGEIDSRDDDKTDFCKKNPNLNVCKNSSVSGACGQTACNGDAIQCAILRQQAKEYCENTTPNDDVYLGKKISFNDDPRQSQINAAITGTSVDLSSQSLDQSGFLNGGGCFHDRSITILGRSIAVSFSSVCNNILPLRYGILACSLIAAYLLVSKSVLQG